MSDPGNACGMVIRDLTTMEEFRSAGELVRRVWGSDPERSPLNVQQLPAMAHAGCQISGAFEDGELVGATMAFLGLEGQQTILHSHVTGVEPSRQGRGLGLALKRYQRQWCLDRGIQVVIWTFDPLIVANARFNLVRLGARGVEYQRDFYGRMGDELNREEPTDRLVARWELQSPEVVDALGSAPSSAPTSADLLAAGAEVVVADEQGEPVGRHGGGDRRLIAVPADTVDLRRDDPDRSARWREAVRTALESALSAGHRIGPVTTEGLLVTEARSRARPVRTGP